MNTKKGDMFIGDIAEDFDSMIENFSDKYELSKEEIAELMVGWLDYNIGVNNFDEGELEKILYALLNNRLSDALAKLSNKIIIANWFDAEDMENLLGREISDEEYEKMIGKWNKGGLFDEISDLVRCFYSVKKKGGDKHE